MLYLNLTDFSTALKRLNLNNVAEVERKESLFSLPKCSSVSKKPHTAERGVVTEGPPAFRSVAYGENIAKACRRQRP